MTWLLHTSKTMKVNGQFTVQKDPIGQRNSQKGTHNPFLIMIWKTPVIITSFQLPLLPAVPQPVPEHCMLTLWKGLVTSHNHRWKLRPRLLMMKGSVQKLLKILSSSNVPQAWSQILQNTKRNQYQTRTRNIMTIQENQIKYVQQDLMSRNHRKINF